MMSNEEIVKNALKRKPSERFEIAEAILHSLDQPDPSVDALWLDEAERRLTAYRKSSACTQAPTGNSEAPVGASVLAISTGRAASPLVSGIPAEHVLGEL